MNDLHALHSWESLQATTSHFSKMDQKDRDYQTTWDYKHE